MRRASRVVFVGFLLVLALPSAAMAGGCHASSEAVTGRGSGSTQVGISNCGYSPSILYVEPGTEVIWVNQDPIPHTVTGMGLSLGADQMLELGDKTETFRFDEAGVYPYYCTVHAGMAGAVVVGDLSADKAAAGEVQSLPAAVPVNDGEPPSGPAKAESSSSSMLVPLLIALTVLAIPAGFLFGRRRRESSEPQPA